MTKAVPQNLAEPPRAAPEFSCSAVRLRQTSAHQDLINLPRGAGAHCGSLLREKQTPHSHGAMAMWRFSCYLCAGESEKTNVTRDVRPQCQACPRKSVSRNFRLQANGFNLVSVATICYWRVITAIINTPIRSIKALWNATRGC